MVFSERRARGRDQPADRQRLGALGRTSTGHLIGRTADAAAADLDARLHIVERVVEDRRAGPSWRAVSTLSSAP